MSDGLERARAALEERYAVERELGRGGAATVYLARDLRHDRDVAIKVLRPDLAALIGTDRFLREIRITARLNHPHILPLLDSGEAAGLLYYVMPHVTGGSLRRLVQQGTTLEETLRVTRQVATALEYAHQHDVIHRDIKPENTPGGRPVRRLHRVGPGAAGRITIRELPGARAGAARGSGHRPAGGGRHGPAPTARAWMASGLVGAALLVWIAVEIAVVGYMAEPLQLAYGLTGAAILALTVLPSVRHHLRDAEAGPG